jgi:hypothetical protein
MRVEIRVIFRGEPLTTPLDAAQSSVDDIFVAYTSVCMLAPNHRPQRSCNQVLTWWLYREAVTKISPGLPRFGGYPG